MGMKRKRGPGMTGPIIAVAVLAIVAIAAVGIWNRPIREWCARWTGRPGSRAGAGAATNLSASVEAGQPAADGRP